MKKLIPQLSCLCFIFIFLFLDVNAQNANGNFRSRQSGNWNSTTTWQLRTGGSWANTTNIPSSSDVVSIQSGHTITLDSNSAANDIHLNTSGVIACSTFTLSAYGKIRAYTGTAVTSALDATYTNSTSPNTGNITCGTGGRLKFVGNTRNITSTSEWGANGLTTSAVVEFALTQGQTGTLNTGFKASTIIISSGNIDMGNNRLAPDSGNAGLGSITIDSGATLISSMSSASTPVMSRTGTASSGRSGTFTLKGTLRLNGTSPYLEFQTVNFYTNSTVEFNGGNQNWINSSFTGADTINSYGNVTLLGTGVTKTTVASLTINIEGILSLQGTAALALGNSSALVFGSSSTLEYKGSAAQSTGSNPAEWPAVNGPNNLTINNSNGVTLGVSRTINGTLSMLNGMLTTSASNILSLGTGSSISNVSNSSFVNGPVKKTGNSAFVFPIGKSGSGYHPLSISAPANSTDAFTAEYIRTNPSTLGTSLSGGLAKISECEYWQLDMSSGSSSVDVSLYGNANSGCNGSTGASYFTGGSASLSDIRIARYNSTLSAWENSGGSTSGTSPDISTMASSLNNFGSFTFATGAGNPLPVKLVSFNAQAISDIVLLSWITATEKDNDHFEVEWSMDGINFTKLAEVKGNGNTTHLSNYSFEDFIPGSNHAQQSLLYYRLKQVDLNNEYVYSDVASVNIKPGSEELAIVPNPAKDNIVVHFNSKICSNVSITIFNSEGKICFQTENKFHLGDNRIMINTEDLVHGFYFLIFSTDYEKKKFKIFFKE